MPPSHRACESSQGHPFRYIGQGHADFHEQPVKYKRGGLHPVLLGDILKHVSGSNFESDSEQHPGYRVVMKLGYGAFATVWLARDVKYERFVAIKICEAFKSEFPASSETREESVLKSLQSLGHETGRHSALLELLDSFVLKGPNGYHQCLVTEIVATLDGLATQDRCDPQVLRQVVDGFAYLHRRGIVHGDPHPANLGVSAPLIQQITEDSIESTLGTPEITPLVLRNSSIPRDAAPAYIVDVNDENNIDFLLAHNEAFPSGRDVVVKILDFGRACKADEVLSTPMPGGVPYAFRPPEVFLFEESHGKLGNMWSTAADVWSVGCILFYIMFGGDLVSTWGSVDDIFRRCLEFGGSPPKTWLEYWNSRESCKSFVGPYFEYQQAWSHQKQRMLARGRVSSTTVDLFLTLLQQIIVTKPENRLTMTQVLQHPFFGEI